MAEFGEQQLLQVSANGKPRVEATHITLDEVPAADERLDKGEHGIGRTMAVPDRIDEDI